MTQLSPDYFDINNPYKVEIWDDNPGPVSGSTPFGYYDDDTEFQQMAPRFAKYAVRRLGYPIVDIELDSGSIYTCFEDAISHYGEMINQFNIKDNLLTLQGNPLYRNDVKVNYTQKSISPNLGRIITIAKEYGNEAGSGGDTNWKKGCITTSIGTGSYDLQALWADVHENSGSIEIKRVFHDRSPASRRYMNPWMNTNAYYAATQFGWANIMGTNYIMMPTFSDTLKIQSVEFNDQIRRSQYSFEIHNNTMILQPVPDYEMYVWFQYLVVDDRNDPVKYTNPSGSISDASNAPYGTLQYSLINNVGKQWINRYGLALVKNALGNVRNKYTNIPIPEGDVTLDGDTLRNEANTEMQQLDDKLLEYLESTGTKALMVAKQEEAQAMQQIFNMSPMKIYIK